MQTTIDWNTDTLDGRLEEGLKRLFPHREICIVAYDLSEASRTSEDLLSDPACRERLLQALDDAKAGRNVVTPDPKLFT